MFSTCQWHTHCGDVAVPDILVGCCLISFTARGFAHKHQTGEYTATKVVANISIRTYQATHSHTHRFTAICPGLPGRAGTRKVKPIWILLKQETVSDSGISWAICKSASRSRQITMPARHHSVFLQARCHSCRRTNSVKALKAQHWKTY